jgi:hypothetical protein
MIEELKVLLGEAADNFTDAQISLCVKLALAEVEGYCNRPVDKELELAVLMIAKIKLVRLNTEGLSSQSLSGVSENYIDGYPADIQALLDRKRKIKVIG